MEKQNKLQASKQQEVGVAVPSLAEEAHLAQNLRFLDFPLSPRADSLAVKWKGTKEKSVKSFSKDRNIIPSWIGKHARFSFFRVGF